MPTWKRKLMVEFAAPQFTEKHPTTENLWMDCPKSLEVRTEKSNAYEAIFVQELKRFMQDSKMIGVYHFNAITNRNYRKAWQEGRGLGMELKRYEHIMVKDALEGTVWKNLIHYLDGTVGRQSFTFTPEVKANSLLQLEKKIPECFLICAVVEDRILDRAQVAELSQMPPKESLLGETVALLNMPSQKLSRLLNHNQQSLSQNLSQYVKDQGKESE